MKYLFLLLPFTLNAQESVVYSISWKYLENTENPYELTFDTPEGQMSFYRGAIVTDSDTLYCNTDIFRILNTTLRVVEEDRQKRLKELQTKIYFYETYFGKLELSDSKECYIFNPVINPPKINKCKQ